MLMVWLQLEAQSNSKMTSKKRKRMESYIVRSLMTFLMVMLIPA